MSAVEDAVNRCPELPCEAGGSSFDRIIRDRFACRDFASRPVSRKTIEEILAVARFAPSGANIQPWRVYVLAGREKERISGAVLVEHLGAPAHPDVRFKYTSYQ